MALFNCPVCGRSISDKAVSCPGCGHPVQQVNEAPLAKKSGSKKVIASIVIMDFHRQKRSMEQTTAVRIGKNRLCEMQNRI